MASMPSTAVPDHGDAAYEATTLTDLATKAGPEESLRSYKMLQALRAGDMDALAPLLAQHVDARKKQRQDSETEVEINSPLHMAVRCAKYPVVEAVLKQAPDCLNAQDPRGQTPLHVAASLNRMDVVALLLLDDKIDDAVKDCQGKTALESAASADTATLISVSRSHYTEKYLALLAAYIASAGGETSASSGHRHTPSLASIRPSRPDATCEISAASGHVSNATAEAVYQFLQQPRSIGIDYSLKDHATGTTLLHEATRRKDLGLIKLAISKGADILARDGKEKIPLEVARDERIKIYLKQAAVSEGRALKASSSHFSSANSGAPLLAGEAPSIRGYLSKWTNMARGYRSRWFVLSNGVLSYYRSHEDEGKASRGSINLGVAQIVSSGSDKLKFEVNNKLGKSFPSFFLKGNHPVEVMRWVDALKQNVAYAKELSNTVSQTPSRAPSIAPSLGGGSLEMRTSTLEPDAAGIDSQGRTLHDRDGSVLADDETFNDDNDAVPHAEDFELLAQGTRTQVELTRQLVETLRVAEADPVNANVVFDEVRKAVVGSLGTLESALDEYIDVVNLRERFFVCKYEREIDAKRMWEENMKELAAQHAAIEAELHKTSRDSTRRKRALQEVRANLLSSPSMSPIAGTPVEANPSSKALQVDTNNLATAKAATPATLSTPRSARGRSATMHTLKPQELEHLVDSALAGEAGEDDSALSDDSDEFFEAVESGQIPVESDDEGKAAPRAPEAEALSAKFDTAPFEGYRNLRQRLPITTDNRPPVSLWAILKGSIGKDLTKISFPVFFNEPTSMLQRMAEDVEFSDVLDHAAAQEDPTRRIAYVAAFAMSNYSSTIGRIAKPFNPMLGETFEFADLSKKYRYISEQVSHHPPISACIAQSPTWEYYGEVDAKSKFMGKSFEIRPTGIAHAKLKIPAAWGPNYPISTTPGLVEEHYSWTKVTTSVSNFLLGNPIIDHFGDMVITNHRTGHVCKLTFKPRGWRSSGAAEVKGKVMDKEGKEFWDLAGKWSSQLVARRVGAGSGDLAPDAAVPTNKDGDVPPEYIRLWKNSEKPTPPLPFNLTPWAVQLNDDNAELRKWLPPTDCRLRPDQHAFENGKFERANDLKSELEDHQRATRRKREQGQLPPHAPRWFRRAKDKDTGESFWEPIKTNDGMVEYWEERTRVGKAKEEGEETEWKGVEPIYADFQV
ncbi:BQ2448_1361 [Microbotryum intermedium]|uniref:BQ2448_1361 protein n=1 Tax=Microbotryum intermedium TaxID=269621 RepID=A0A238F9X8_9BASI|nr:BQ2448_1361 [Microbotryum intermedium]